MWTARTVGCGVVNTHVIQEIPLHPKKMKEWRAVSLGRVTEPFLVEVIVEGGIVTQFTSKLEHDNRDCWFQQDGVTWHTWNDAIQEKTFPMIVLFPKPYGPRDHPIKMPSIFNFGVTKTKWYTATTHTQCRGQNTNTEFEISKITFQVHHTFQQTCWNVWCTFIQV